MRVLAHIATTTLLRTSARNPFRIFLASINRGRRIDRVARLKNGLKRGELFQAGMKRAGSKFFQLTSKCLLSDAAKRILVEIF